MTPTTPRSQTWLVAPPTCPLSPEHRALKLLCPWPDPDRRSPCLELDLGFQSHSLVHCCPSQLLLLGQVHLPASAAVGAC